MPKSVTTSLTVTILFIVKCSTLFNLEIISLSFSFVNLSGTSLFPATATTLFEYDSNCHIDILIISPVRMIISEPNNDGIILGSIIP